MEKIESFKVDHTKIVPGMYISRIDGDVTTYDLRFCKPNEAVLSGAGMHTIEHLFATFIRNTDLSVLYFGPMGCMTGFYLLIRDADHMKVWREIQKVLDAIADFSGEIFGATEIECGNYKFHDLAAAHEAVKAFRLVLETPPALTYPA